MTRLTEVFNSLEQWSLTFLAPETDTVEGNFSIGQGRGDPRDGFRMILIRCWQPRSLTCTVTIGFILI